MLRHLRPAGARQLRAARAARLQAAGDRGGRDAAPVEGRRGADAAVRGKLRTVHPVQRRNICSLTDIAQWSCVVVCSACIESDRRPTVRRRAIWSRRPRSATTAGRRARRTSCPASRCSSACGARPSRTCGATRTRTLSRTARWVLAAAAEPHQRNGVQDLGCPKRHCLPLAVFAGGHT